MRRPIVIALLSLPLAGCATFALKMSPERPDAPWTAATDENGQIIAGQRSAPDQPKSGNYVLPSNQSLAGAPPAATDLQRHRPYTLPELIDIAETTNPSTRNAWNDARNAALAAGIAESTFLPFVSAGIVQGWQKVHNQLSLLGLPADNDFKAHGNVEVLSVQWLLFDFGERAALLDVAKQGSVVSNIAFTAAHQQVIYNVTLAFYAHAAARAHFVAAAKSLKDAENIQAAAESRYQRGLGTVVEVAQTRQATAQARLDEVQTQGAAQNSYLALIAALGISPMTKLDVADISRRHLPPALTAPIEDFVAQALARRPDVLSGYAGVQASLAGLRAAQAEFFPKVFASAVGTHSAGDLSITALPGVGEQLAPVVNLPGGQLAAAKPELGGTALIGAAVPLYDGGMRAALLEQARDRVDKAETTLTQIRNEAARQIIVARNTLRTSLSAYRAAKTLAAAAQTTFDAALTAYRNGVGSITDVTIAERQLLAAENAATDAYSGALSAAATLALAAGVLG